jgi:carboxymethylenebutenolidase
MCVPADSTTPIDPTNAAVETQALTLRADDGNDFSAFSAVGESNDGPAVMVLPDIRGLFSFYAELSLRFAQHGNDAVAIDYFGRTAGLDEREAEWDCWPHVNQTTQAGILADAAGAMAFLRKDDPTRKVVTVGFCFGGSNSWHLSASGLGLNGAVGFYGHPNRPGFPIGAPGIVDRVEAIECPIRGFFGGADQGIPQSEIDGFGAAMSSAGIDHQLKTYAGAPHSFFDRKYAEFAGESADAWALTQQFLSEVGQS